VLAVGPKINGSKPAEGDELLRALEIRSTTSFRGDVKSLVPCKILRNVKESCGYERETS
jgi:hypothetical protein